MTLVECLFKPSTYLVKANKFVPGQPTMPLLFSVPNNLMST